MLAAEAASSPDSKAEGGGSGYGVAKKNLSRAATLLPSSKEVRSDYAKCTELAAQKKAAMAFDVSDGADAAPMLDE